MKDKNFEATPHKIGDSIVMDAIKAINLVKQSKKINGYVGGGMAVGAYIPYESQRPTIDLDFNLYWGGSAAEFKQIMEPLSSELSSQDYDLRIQRKDKTYNLFLQSDRDSLLLQHSRRNKKNFKKNRKSLEREMQNQRLISTDDVSFAALSPEDLVLHKLSRLFTFSDVYGIAIPQRMKTGNMMKTIKFFRENQDTQNGRENILIRMYHDSYDIKHLAKYVGLNKKYFEEGLKDWTGKYMTEDSAKFLLNSMNIELE